MQPANEDLWRTLQRGDRVRIVHYPCEFSEHEYTMHEETRAAYRHLIETKKVLAVDRIDNDGYPWVEFEISDMNGDVEYHSLMLNHDGIERLNGSPT
jgi:hypothetical protein